jgi:hypothetical protein
MPGLATQKLLDYLEFCIVHEVHMILCCNHGPSFVGYSSEKSLKPIAPWDIGSCAGLYMQPSYVWYFLP